MKSTEELVTTVLAFTLASCTSISENIKDNDQSDIRENLISVHNQPGLYTGQQARFGGKVANMISTKNDTLLEIAVLPLNDPAKPQIDASYQGHTLAQQKGFLGSANYRNHFVTALGIIQGDESGSINRAPYNLVKADLQGVQVWHLTGSANITYSIWDYGYGAFWPEPTWGASYYANTVTQVTPELVK